MSDIEATGFMYIRVKNAIEVVKVKGGDVTLRVMGNEIVARKGSTVDLAPLTVALEEYER